MDRWPVMRGNNNGSVCALFPPLCGCNVHKMRKRSCRWHHLISSLLGYICFKSGKRWRVGKTILRVLFCVALRGKLKIAFSVLLAGDVRPSSIILPSYDFEQYSKLFSPLSHVLSLKSTVPPSPISSTNFPSSAPHFRVSACGKR